MDGSNNHNKSPGFHLQTCQNCKGQLNGKDHLCDHDFKKWHENKVKKIQT